MPRNWSCHCSPGGGSVIAMNVRVCAALILALTCSVAQAVTCTSVAGANSWSVAAPWTCPAGGAHVPANGEDVVIANTSTVTLNVPSNTLASLTVNGTLGL